MTTEEAIAKVATVKNRIEAAQVYAHAMYSPNAINWKELNHAILERWTMAGLIFIKEKAWAFLEEQETGASPQ